MSIDQIRRKISPAVERLNPEQREKLFQEGIIVNQENQLKFKDEEVTKTSTTDYEHFFEEDLVSVEYSVTFHNINFIARYQTFQSRKTRSILANVYVTVRFTQLMCRSQIIRKEK